MKFYWSLKNEGDKVMSRKHHAQKDIYRNQGYLLAEDVERKHKISAKVVKNMIKHGLPYYTFEGLKLKFFKIDEVLKFASLHSRGPRGKSYKQKVHLKAACRQCRNEFEYTKKDFMSYEKKKRMESGVIRDKSFMRNFCDACLKIKRIEAAKNQKHHPMTEEQKLILSKITKDWWKSRTKSQVKALKQKMSNKRKEFWNNNLELKNKLSQNCSEALKDFWNWYREEHNKEINNNA